MHEAAYFHLTGYQQIEGGTVNRNVQPLFNHHEPGRHHRPFPRGEP